MVSNICILSGSYPRIAKPGKLNVHQQPTNVCVCIIASPANTVFVTSIYCLIIYRVIFLGNKIFNQLNNDGVSWSNQGLTGLLLGQTG